MNEIPKLRMMIETPIWTLIYDHELTCQELIDMKHAIERCIQGSLEAKLES